MKELITHSRQDCFKVCRKKHHFAYELRLRPLEDGKAIRIGSAFHAGLGALGNGYGLGAACREVEVLYAECPENFDSYWLDIERETVLRLICAYDWRWSAAPLEYLVTERTFQFPLVNPATGKPTPLFDIAGKIDGIVRLEDGRLAVKESKTVSDDIGPDSDLWRRLRMDHQISLYIHAARQLGFPVDTVLYDVTRKPTIAPEAVPILDGEELKIVLDAHGERVRNASKKAKKSCDICEGTGELKEAVQAWDISGAPVPACPCTFGPWRQTGDGERGYVLQTRPMTPEEWGEKLTNDIQERPDFYFARVEIPRLDQDVEEYQSELWEIQQAIREAQRTGRWYRTVNRHTCNWCPYFDLCCTNTSIDQAHPPSGFEILTDPHPELRSNDVNSNTAETSAATAEAGAAAIH